MLVVVVVAAAAVVYYLNIFNGCCQYLQRESSHKCIRGFHRKNNESQQMQNNQSNVQCDAKFTHEINGDPLKWPKSSSEGTKSGR